MEKGESGVKQTGTDRSQMMLEEKVSRVIPKMAVPTIVAFLINSIYSLADTYFVSSLGIEATAAVSVNASLDQLIMMAGSLLAVGAASYIARLLGQEKKDEASSVLSTAFFIAASFGLVLAILGSSFIHPWCAFWAPPPPASSTASTMPLMCCWQPPL